MFALSVVTITTLPSLEKKIRLQKTIKNHLKNYFSRVCAMDIKKMSEALLKGEKMLSSVCPNCYAPLFEKDGQVRCLNCLKEIPQVQTQKVESSSLIDDIKRVQNNLRLQLKTEGDPVKVKNILESIEKCIDLIKKLGEDNGS